MESEKLYRREDFRDVLNVSLATVNNWIKTGIIPAPDKNGNFTMKTFSETISYLKKTGIKLNSRANRSQSSIKFMVYLGISNKQRRELLDEAVKTFEESDLSIEQGVVSLGWAILNYNNLLNKDSMVIKKLCTIMGEKPSSRIISVFKDFKIENNDDDFLGAFYQSIQNISAKSIAGSYYTPSYLLRDISIPLNSKVVDPCCGSGGILLKVLSKHHDPSLVWARDIDKIALFICEINLALFFSDPDMAAHVEYYDIICNGGQDLFADSDRYDIVISNPPWGSKLSRKEKDSLLLSYPQLHTTEVFSIALFNSINMLNEKGQLYFFLPESLLSVGAHKDIRKLLVNGNYDIEIKHLGNVFKGVQSKCFLLKLIKSESNKTAIKIENGYKYAIQRKNIVPPDYLIPISMDKNDKEIIQRIYSVQSAFLSNSDIFALGIVTGNNKANLMPKITGNAEPIYRGKDLDAYKFKKPEVYIEFMPEKYQQVAPIRYYRSRKIVYKFISNRIICVLDENKSLLLNSANLFIPKNYPMETIVCLFNSCFYSFLFQKKFNSNKVLKSHLQALPLPLFSKKEHDVIKDMYNELLKGNVDETELELYFMNYFKFDNEEYNYIRKAVYGNT